MEYQVIDNALPDDDAQLIKEIMTSSSFQWFYLESVTHEGTYDLNQFYFIHLFYDEDRWNSPWSDQIIKPIAKILNPKTFMRIKGNFYPRTDSELVENYPHVDEDFSHRGAIYYVNSNDGFTVLEDGTKIESVENRILLFDPSKPHYSTHCTNQHGRININFNFF